MVLSLCGFSYRRVEGSNCSRFSQEESWGLGQTGLWQPDKAMVTRQGYVPK